MGPRILSPFFLGIEQGAGATCGEVTKGGGIKIRIPGEFFKNSWPGSGFLGS